MTMLAPSILSADFANLQRDVELVLAAGADWLHVDVMDGHFVPNISIGVPVVKSLRKATGGFLDVHLMISQPERYLDAFAKAGADLLNIHVEAEGDMEAMLRHIRELGCKSALTIKPNTAPEAVFPYLPLCDMVLVMSVEPGFGGQKFMPSALPSEGGDPASGSELSSGDRRRHQPAERRGSGLSRRGYSGCRFRRFRSRRCCGSSSFF